MGPAKRFLGFAPVWFASPIAAHDERTEVLGKVWDRPVLARHDATPLLKRKDMKERLHIGQMRQRLGLKPDDKSQDDRIEKMQPIDRLKLLCGWHLGDPAWAHQFLNWARDAGFKIPHTRS
jgi:hypothetical protein